MTDTRAGPPATQALEATRVGRALARLWESFPGRCARSFLELQGIDRAMAIAAQAFTALVPLLLLTSELSGHGESNAAADAIVRRFHLTGDSAQAVHEFFASPGGGSVGVLSAVLLLFSGVSFTRRVQRMYQDAWRVPPRAGMRGSLNALLGLAALILEIYLLSEVLSLLRSWSFGPVITWPLSVLTSLLLWTSIPWLLLDRRVRWRRLLSGGALTGICAALYSVATTIYMPRLIESYFRRYGLFGLTLALIGWLVATSLIVVAATAVAAEFDRAEEPWARRWRGRIAGRTTPSLPDPDPGGLP